MPVLNLSDAEAQELLYVLANAEGPGIKWSRINPLLMSIGGQLQQQQPKVDVTRGNGIADSSLPDAKEAADTGSQRRLGKTHV